MNEQNQPEMSDQLPNILLLEDTRTVQNYIRDILRSLTVPHELHAARRIEEATRIAGERQIALFIVDIGLPDGDGMDFLCAMSAMHPGARALIITSTPREDYRDRARDLGVLHFLPKPLQRKELIEKVTAMLTVRETATPETRKVSGGFEGTLGGLTPADIIQLKCVGRATGKIEFSTEDRFGFVWFENGEVSHAEADSVEGRMSGITAFQFIVSWRSGTAREVPDAGAAPRTITKSWQALIMDASDSPQPASAPA